jgi:hypothetical protein
LFTAHRPTCATSPNTSSQQTPSSPNNKPQLLYLGPTTYNFIIYLKKKDKLDLSYLSLLPLFLSLSLSLAPLLSHTTCHRHTTALTPTSPSTRQGGYRVCLLWVGKGLFWFIEHHSRHHHHLPHSSNPLVYRNQNPSIKKSRDITLGPHSCQGNLLVVPTNSSPTVNNGEGLLVWQRDTARRCPLHVGRRGLTKFLHRVFLLTTFF